MPEEFSLFENVWLKSSFELRCLTGSFAGNTRRFEKHAEHILRTINSNDYGLLSQYPKIPRLMGMQNESREWTVFMVVDHLRLHIDFVLNAIRALVIDDELRTAVPRFRYLVPDDVGAECIDQFQDSVWQYTGFVGNLFDSGKFREPSGSILHPWLGRLNVKRLHAYAGFHLSIHRSQIQKILATEGIA
jgi:hypothetical protein